MTKDYLADCQPFDDWHESIFDDAKAIAALMGWDITDIEYSGFCSQGDGASFVGVLGYAKGCVSAVKAYAPEDTELHAIAEAWQAFQRGTFYRYRAQVVRTSHHYAHGNTVQIDNWGDSSYERDAAAIEIARDFMRWIYRQLEKEYEYQCAWQAARRWQDAGEDMAEARKEARQLVRDMRAARKGTAAPESICSALRRQLRALIDRWESARDERDGIDSAFTYWPKRQNVAAFAAENL